jgi:hypothetical protein
MNLPLIPYPGLRPFEEKDYEIFFGREIQIIQMLRQLEHRRFLTVVGASGCGKSSLVMAGLLPAIRRGFLQESKNWLVVPPVKPGRDPYRRLASALSGCAALADLARCDATQSQRTEEVILDALRETDKGLLDALAKLEIAPAANVILVVDQFEDLLAFRWTKAGDDKVAPRNDAASFVRMLLRSCSDPNERVWVVTTMRSDFIGDCEAFLGLPEAVSRSQFLVPRLDRNQMEEAIVRPGEVRRAAFQRFTFEQDLVNRIINDAGDRPDQLPMMQHALMRTWRRAVSRSSNDRKLVLTHWDYEKVGGITEALSWDADEVWDTIKGDPKKAQLARRLFLLLCDVSPDRQITRRRPQVAEVMGVTGATLSEVEEVVREFQADDRNFLLPPSDESLTPVTYLDISHEALLRRWRLFSQWLREEREAVAELWRLVSQLESGVLIQAKDFNRIALWRENNRMPLEWAKRYLTTPQLTELAAQEANIAAQQAQGVLTDNLFRTMGVSNTRIPMQAEREALWELAQLDRADAAVREKLLNRWFDTPEAFERAEARDGQSFRAATGLNLQYHRLAVSGAGKLGRRLAADLQNAKETDRYRPSFLASALTALAAKMESQTAAEIAKALASTLENPNETDHNRLSSLERALVALTKRLESQTAAEIARRLVAALEKTEVTAPSWLSGLDSAELTKRLESQTAAEIARRLVAALEKTEVTAPSRVSSLGQSLAAIAAKLEPQAATEITGVLAEITRALKAASQGPVETELNRLSTLSSALAALTAKPEPLAGAKLATRAAQHLMAVLEDLQRVSADRISSLKAVLGDLGAITPPETDSSRLSTLASAPAALTAESRRKADIEKRGVQLFAEAMEIWRKTDGDRLLSLGVPLAALTDKMQPQQAASEIATRGAQLVASAMEDSKEKDAGRLSRLGISLVALAIKMEPQDAAQIASRLAAGLEKTEETDPDRLSSLGSSLAAIAAKLEPQAATEIARRLVAALEKTEVTAPSRVSSLGQSLAAIAAKLEPQPATEIAKRLLAALENPQETDSNRLFRLGSALAAMAKKIEPHAAAEFVGRSAQRIVATVENSKETDVESLSSLANALAALATKMEPQAATLIAKRLAAAFDNRPETDSNRLSSLSNALAALAAKMEPQDAAWIARILMAAMENPQETDSDRLLSLGSALAALTAKMEPQDVAGIARRRAQQLAAALDKPENTDSERLSRLGVTLAAFCALLPSAYHTHLLSLSNLLLTPILKKKDEGEEQQTARKLLTAMCAKLRLQDLVEVLKYPFCTGEAEQSVLKAIDLKFGSNLWEFVERADDLGIKDIDRPAKRPSAHDALQELDELQVQ